jgi:hypothetical protein
MGFYGSQHIMILYGPVQICRLNFQMAFQTPTTHDLKVPRGARMMQVSVGVSGWVSHLIILYGPLQLLLTQPPNGLLTPATRDRK